MIGAFPECCIDKLLAVLQIFSDFFHIGNSNSMKSKTFDREIDYYRIYLTHWNITHQIFVK